MKVIFCLFPIFLFFPLTMESQSVVFVGTSVPDPNIPTGEGTRMMWIPALSALRSGSLETRPMAWDPDSIGEQSVAFGGEVLATGQQSFATGFRSSAYGLRSSAGGFVNQALGTSSVSLGRNLISKSFGEIALGSSNSDYNISSGGDVNFNIQDRLLTIGNGESFFPAPGGIQSNAVEIYKNGNMVLFGAPIFKVDTVTMKADNQVLQVSTTGYKRVASNTATATNRTALLSNGLYAGQLLYLECACGAAQWELASGGNVNLPAVRTFSKGTIMQLLWNGSQWLEMHYSDN